MSSQSSSLPSFPSYIRVSIHLRCEVSAQSSSLPIFHPNRFNSLQTGRTFRTKRMEGWKNGRVEERKVGRMTIGRMRAMNAYASIPFKREFPSSYLPSFPSHLRVSIPLRCEVSSQSSSLPSFPSYIRVSIHLRCEVSAQSSSLPIFHPNGFNSLQTGRTFRTKKNGRLEEWKTGRLEV